MYLITIQISIHPFLYHLSNTGFWGTFSLSQGTWGTWDTLDRVLITHTMDNLEIPTVYSACLEWGEPEYPEEKAQKAGENM